MTMAMSLDHYLDQITAKDSGHTEAAELVRHLAQAIIKISQLIALGPLAGAMGTSVGRNSDGDTQKKLDVLSQELMMQAMDEKMVAAIASEELDHWVVLNPEAPLAVAFDPLDGSSNIDTNLSVGTIFSILPAKGAENPFFCPGTAQLAAGFAIYGPQTSLVLSFGDGVDILTLDPRDMTFRLTSSKVQILSGVPEFAINASNYRHWEAPVRTYVDDCFDGAEGPRGRNFNMRWLGSLVAETFRILARGGVFLYPADKRKGYETGRLRLIYEAHPIAFLIEQAGGIASTGRDRILDLAATSLHQRVPLIFGSKDKLELIERLHLQPEGESATSPLFGHRGLFRL